VRYEDVAMNVCDFTGSQDVTNVQQLEVVLTRRYENNANAYWLSHEGGQYPELGLLVKDDLAYLSYVPAEYEDGFASVGKMGDSLPGEETTFFLTRGGEKIWVVNHAVLPFSVALAAAKDFFFSDKLYFTRPGVRHGRTPGS
jgi:hypothetical protein